MDFGRLPDISEAGQWQLIARQSYAAVLNPEATTHVPIPPKTWTIENSHLLCIGIGCENSLPSWYTGGWAAQRLLLSPGATVFLPNVQTINRKLKLGSLNLFDAPKLAATWLLYVKFPRWFIDASIEIWAYQGRDLDAMNNGAIQAVPNTIPQSATAVEILEANVERKGAIIMNESNSPLALEMDGTPTMGSNLVVLQPGGYFEIPYGFKGQIQGIWNSAGSGFAKVREFF